MSTDAAEALLAARKLLETVTPLRTDCGRTCGHACCQPDETGRGGMLLFPGEEKLYEEKQGFTITPDAALEIPALLLTCEGRCDRKERPLSCRIFPLLPKLRDGQVRAVRDRRGFEICPLLPGGLGAFDPEFVAAVRAAGEALYAVGIHRQFLDCLHAHIAQFTL